MGHARSSGPAPSFLVGGQPTREWQRCQKRRWRPRKWSQSRGKRAKRARMNLCLCLCIIHLSMHHMIVHLCMMYDVSVYIFLYDLSVCIWEHWEAPSRCLAASRTERKCQHRNTAIDQSSTDSLTHSINPSLYNQSSQKWRWTWRRREAADGKRWNSRTPEAVKSTREASAMLTTTSIRTYIHPYIHTHTNIHRVHGLREKEPLIGESAG